MRNLHDWPEQEPDAPAELFLINDPPRTMTEDRVCLPCASRGMCDVLRWFADSSVDMFVDAKQSCMAHGWGVITASIAVRDQLRYTTLGRSEGRRIQARAYTSHAEPVLQAIINVENTENISQFFETLKRLWARVVPQRPELAKCITQVHKDYHPALEAARKEHFPRSRPVNDFFHLLEKSKTIEARLDRRELVGKVYKKAEFGWVMASLHAFRHLPTADLYSARWEAWLRRLEQKGEQLLAAYLGPGGHEFYTTRVSVKNIRETYGISTMNDDVEAELLFSPHWSGVYGICPRSTVETNHRKPSTHHGRSSWTFWGTRQSAHRCCPRCKSSTAHGRSNATGRATSRYSYFRLQWTTISLGAVCWRAWGAARHSSSGRCERRTTLSWT